MEINLLSIKQPWVWCIFNAGKDIENRSWRTKYRGRLFIHASKSIDMDAYRYLEHHKEQYGIKQMPTIDELKKQTGGIVGVVEMTSCRQTVTSKWKQPGSIGWVFRNAQKLNFVPFKGKLSIFRVPLTPSLKIRLGLTE